MPTGRRRYLPVSPKALFHNPNLVSFAPVPPTRAIRGRKDFNLGSELMVGHKVGLITGVEIPSDGLHRRDTAHPAAPVADFVTAVLTHSWQALSNTFASFRG